MNSGSTTRNTAVGCGEFSLTDHFNRAVTQEVLRHTYTLVLFGFTHCRVVCPRALARYSSVLERVAGEGLLIRGIYITVDPDRDTPDVMRQYLQPFPAFVGLTGDVAQAEKAKAAFRVFARRVSDPLDPEGYRVPHTAIAYLLAPDICCLAHFTDALSENEIVTRLLALLQNRDWGEESRSEPEYDSPAMRVDVCGNAREAG